MQPAHINLGLAIDLAKPDGTRQLLVPSIKGADTMDFAAVLVGVRGDRAQGARQQARRSTTSRAPRSSLTNPGGIGTVHSVPRLMQGQGAIIGVGAMEYPAECQGAAEETLARHAISKIMTLTSTYDHRIIQGAQSGEFLRRSTSCCSASDELLRRHLPRAAHPVRADPLGRRTSRPRTTTTSTRPRACTS